MHSTGYVIRFIVIICSISALVLALLSTTFKERHERNEAIYNKRAILSAVEAPLGQQVGKMTDDEVQEIFDTQMEQRVIDIEGNVVDDATILAHGYKEPKAEFVDMAKERKRPEEDRILPLFVFNQDGEEYYIVSVRGNGLWDEIWGNIAIEDDFRTVAGAAFDHKAETPGLGAEIKDNPAFSAQFIGKKLYDSEGNYTSVVVRKGGAKNERYEVDGISGATITCNGVTEMMKRGIDYYRSYFQEIQGN